ncbi:uncharacterized protein JCM6883_006109 [Sporobolomyces salmoneus]|uniref:uncharacterized protein n=1 Tax=Sporobolomyces salmoneus TaxID=183962 RepID=UPI00317DDE07
MSWLGTIFGATPLPSTPQPPLDEPVPSSSLSAPSPPQPPRDKTIRVGVLLDGDADYFTQAYTSKGYRGGRSAALDLRNKVYHYILSRTASKAETTKTVEIIAFSFLNLNGLSSFLGPGVEMRAFAQGFNSSPYAFSMSDVGNGPQAADEAIKSHLPFLLSTCTHVLLGGTHDGGYSQTLLRLDPSTLREKVLLLRTTSFCAERILELGLEEVRFEGLFEGRDPTARSYPSSNGFINQSPKKQYQQQQQPGISSNKPFTSLPPFQNLVDRLAPTSTPVIAPPSPSLSVSSTTSTPSISVGPILTASTTPPTSLSSIPVDFTPLLQTLNHYLHSRNQPQPRCADIGQNLRLRHPQALKVKLERDGPLKEIGFGEYAKEAQRRGLVRLGRGEKIGSEWIELVRDAGAAAKEKDNNQALSTVPSTASSPNSNETNFIPLLQLLVQFATEHTPRVDRPLRAIVGEKLARLPNPPFPPQPGHFRFYYDKACREGLVRVGRGDVAGAEWIELAIGLEEAKRMIANSRIASSSSSEPSTSAPTPAQPISTPTPPTPQGDISLYLPLLEVLLAHLPSTPQPEWTPIAGFVASYSPRPYSHEPGSFKRYVEGAKAAGLIETGRVNGKEFNFWMRLKGTKEEVEGLIEREKKEGRVRFRASRGTKAMLPNLVGGGGGTTTTQPTPQAVSTTPGGATKPKVDIKFYPLIKALQGMLPESIQEGIEWTKISERTTTRPSEYREPGGFKRYLLAAQKDGLVETGSFEGQRFTHWPSLIDFKTETALAQATSTPPASSSTITSTTPTPAVEKTIPVPTRFLPLVRAIHEHRFDRPFCSQIAFILTTKTHPRPFQPEVGWGGYLNDAVQNGIAECGKTGTQGQEWVKIRDGVDYPPSSPAPAASSTTNSPPALVVPSPSTDPRTNRPTPSLSTTPTVTPPPPNSSSSSSGATIPPALLQHWNSLYDSHSYSPLILTMNFIESSTASSSDDIPYDTIKEYLDLLPGGFTGAWRRSFEEDEKASLRLYLIGAQADGVIIQHQWETEEVKGTARLKPEYKGWKGR